MPNGKRAQIKAVAAQLQQAFESAGAVMREPDSLLPAEVLLDLYGEDIRARAYVTLDPVQGEMMLRPDFTVPVVQMHMAEGTEPARYAYNGSIWRKQNIGSVKGRETTQVGFELFSSNDPATADAEVFALFNRLLDSWRGGDAIGVATGDIGILQAAVNGLATTELRKRALLRHLWRPQRFRQLLDRFAGFAPVPPGRAELVSQASENRAETLVDAAGPLVGLRTVAEIAARITDLGQDQEIPPISDAEYDVLERILSLNSGSVAALQGLRAIQGEMPVLSEAIDRMEARLAALSSRGIDVESLPFAGNYGLTAMEYYDGFVFGFFAKGRPELGTLAGGGRYDALTRVLGQGRTSPAVGGIMVPEALVELEGGAP